MDSTSNRFGSAMSFKIQCHCNTWLVRPLFSIAKFIIPDSLFSPTNFMSLKCHIIQLPSSSSAKLGDRTGLPIDGPIIHRLGLPSFSCRRTVDRLYFFHLFPSEISTFIPPHVVIAPGNTSKCHTTAETELQQGFLHLKVLPF